MTTQTLSNVAIAIASDSVQQRSRLRKLAEHGGMQVVLMEPLTRLFLRKLEKSNAAILLLDIHDNAEHDEQLFNELLDSVSIPIIFNDVTALTVNERPEDTKWYHGLLRKIAESTGNDHVDIADLSSSASIKKPVLPYKPTTGHHAIAGTVWVLGASLGGPEALKRFLAVLPGDIPAAFIVAQHLGANFVQLLAAQLDRGTKLQVMPAREGMLLCHQQVVVTPVNERLTINPIGNIELQPTSVRTSYQPSIDQVITDIANRYGKRAGAVIFSGMGDDGLQGCQYLRSLGGRVWVQSAETCVISSMPDNVRRNCDVQVVGSPEYLARRLTGSLMMSRAEVN